MSFRARKLTHTAQCEMQSIKEKKTPVRICMLMNVYVYVCVYLSMCVSMCVCAQVDTSMRSLMEEVQENPACIPLTKV